MSFLREILSNLSVTNKNKPSNTIMAGNDAANIQAGNLDNETHATVAFPEEQEQTQEESFNPFDVYQQMRNELYGDEVKDVDEEKFNKILSGEIETDDALALSIIEAAKTDNNIEELSQEEIEVFYENLYTNKIEGINIDELEDVDSDCENLFEAQMEDIVQKYLNKSSEDCTNVELNYAYAISLIDGILESSLEGLKKQDASDGAISEIFDWMKETTDLGTCQKDVEEALKKQEEIVSELKKAVNDDNFEQRYEELTGVKYDPEKIALYQQKNAELQFVSMGLVNVESFCAQLKETESSHDTKGTLDAFIGYYGDEKGREEFCKLIKNYHNNHPESMYYNPSNPIKEITVNENNEYEVVYNDGTKGNWGSIEYTPEGALNCVFRNDFKEAKAKEYLENFENTTGIKYEELVEECNTLSKEALGDANAVSNVLNDYVSSQEGFIDSCAGFVQVAGAGTMLIGAGVACFVPMGQGAGLAMIKAGQIAAIAGTFGDEALETIDKATNEKTFDEDLEEYKQILKDALTDGALFAAGYASGTIANGVGQMVLSKTGNQLISKFADIGLDATMSLMSDMMITGEIDLKGEGFSQFIGIMTGSAFARANAANTKMLSIADDILKTGDLDGAVNYLKNQGASKQTIEDFKISAEINKLNTDIENGKLSAQDAIEKLESQGISEKMLIQFKKSHGIEHRTSTQIIQDLIKKEDINGAFAKEAILDYKLSEYDAIQYATYRQWGSDSDVAFRNVLYDKITPEQKIESLVALGATPEQAKLYTEDMNFKEYDAINQYLNGDVEQKMEYLKKCGVSQTGDPLKYIAESLDNFDAISSFARLTSYGIDGDEANMLLPHTPEEKIAFNKSLEYSQMDLYSRINELKALGVTENLIELAQISTPVDYIKMNKMIGLGIDANEAAYYSQHLTAGMLYEIDYTLANDNGALKRLIEAGYTKENLQSISESLFGVNYNQFDDPSLEARISKLEEVSKNPEINNALISVIKNDYSLSAGCGNKDFSKYYDDLNYILNGPPVDEVLKTRLDDIGSRYGISIKAENDIGTPGCMDASHIIDKEYLQAIDDTLALMKEKGLEIPKEIYLSDFKATASGVFNTYNPDAISLNISDMNDPNWVQAVILHESAHMSDWNENTKHHNSFDKAVDAGIVYSASEALNKDIKFNNKTITPSEITGIIRGYATSNILEFKAEVEALINYGTIIPDGKGGYTIDTNNIPPCGYCSDWKGSKENKQSLAKIMELYNYLIS